jgi:hypothetical protein
LYGRTTDERSAEYYRGEAVRCLKMSESARDPALRKHLQEVASICDELAELLQELEQSAQRLDGFPS